MLSDKLRFWKPYSLAFLISLQEMEQSKANRKEWQGVNCNLIIKVKHSQGTDILPAFSMKMMVGSISGHSALF